MYQWACKRLRKIHGTNKIEHLNPGDFWRFPGSRYGVQGLENPFTACTLFSDDQLTLYFHHIKKARVIPLGERHFWVWKGKLLLLVRYLLLTLFNFNAG